MLTNAELKRKADYTWQLFHEAEETRLDHALKAEACRAQYKLTSKNPTHASHDLYQESIRVRDAARLELDKFDAMVHEWCVERGSADEDIDICTACGWTDRTSCERCNPHL